MHEMGRTEFSELWIALAFAFAKCVNEELGEEITEKARHALDEMDHVAIFAAHTTLQPEREMGRGAA